MFTLGFTLGFTPGFTPMFTPMFTPRFMPATILIVKNKIPVGIYIVKFPRFSCLETFRYKLILLQISDKAEAALFAYLVSLRF